MKPMTERPLGDMSELQRALLAHDSGKEPQMHLHDVIAALGCTAAAVFLGLFFAGWL